MDGPPWARSQPRRPHRPRVDGALVRRSTLRVDTTEPGLLVLAAVHSRRVFDGQRSRTQGGVRRTGSATASFPFAEVGAGRFTQAILGFVAMALVAQFHRRVVFAAVSLALSGLGDWCDGLLTAVTLTLTLTAVARDWGWRGPSCSPSACFRSCWCCLGPCPWSSGSTPERCRECFVSGRSARRRVAGGAGACGPRAVGAEPGRVGVCPDGGGAEAQARFLPSVPVLLASVDAVQRQRLPERSWPLGDDGVTHSVLLLNRAGPPQSQQRLKALRGPPLAEDTAVGGGRLDRERSTKRCLSAGVR